MGFSPIAWSRARAAPALPRCRGGGRPRRRRGGGRHRGEREHVGRAATFAGYHAPATVSTTLYRGSTSDADQAPRRDLRRERVVRPLLRHLPVRGEHGRHPVHAKPGTPTVNGLYTKITEVRPGRPAAHQQPERVQPAAADPLRGAHLRPEPRLHAGAEGRRRRQDGHVRPEHRVLHARPPAARPSTARPASSWTTTTATPSTALWNYAQNYSMSDNNWDTTFGPSTPGALNVISGDTSGADGAHPDLVHHPEPAGHVERHRDERRLA